MASNYIKQVADNIYKHPEGWSGVPGVNGLYTGLTDGYIVSQCGLGGRWAWVSIAELHVGGNPFKLQGNDKKVLDRAVLWWWRTQPAERVIGNHSIVP